MAFEGLSPEDKELIEELDPQTAAALGKTGTKIIQDPSIRVSATNNWGFVRVAGVTTFRNENVPL
ncbi:MAG: hypothetical protein QG647_148 [Patescibacteria group bacterium]|nr:hypothetical protein [Patescibacteria group bacterium]